jgi:hypothetical protein
MHSIRALEDGTVLFNRALNWTDEDRARLAAAASEFQEL